MPPVFAHRGASGATAENTMQAFAAALRVGFDGFECDLRVNRDGTVVCVHDATLKRTHGLPRRVRTLTDAETRALDIPDVHSVLERFPTARIIFDVKDRRCLSTLATLANRRVLKPCVHWLLLPDEAGWPRPHTARCLTRTDYHFAPGHDHGIACKFSGSAANAASIRRALRHGKHVNLFTPDRARRDAMFAFAEAHGCSVTV